MALGEKAIVLAQNLLDNAALTANSIPAHEPERMRDGFKHTWWEAPATSIQDIVIEVENKIVNPDFEVDIVGWQDTVSGGGAGTFARNTTSPLFGDADGLATVTVANASTQVFLIFSFNMIFMEAGKTYRIQLAAKVDDASSKDIRLGFLAEDLTEDANLYDVKSIATTSGGHHADFTALQDQWVFPYIRALEPMTLHIDEFGSNEARDADTLIISKGHTMKQATIEVQTKDIPVAFSGGWGTVFGPSKWNNDDPVYLTWTGARALSWRVRVTVFASYAFTPAAQIPTMAIGKRWELNNVNFVSSYDPNESIRAENTFVSEKGIKYNTLKSNQRRIRATISPFIDRGPEHDKLREFFQDTENGFKPFFFVRFPQTELRDILYLRLKRGESIPFQSAGIRTWAMDAEEIVGDRVL